MNNVELIIGIIILFVMFTLTLVKNPFKKKQNAN